MVYPDFFKASNKVSLYHWIYLRKRCIGRGDGISEWANNSMRKILINTCISNKRKDLVATEFYPTGYLPKIWAMTLCVQNC